MIRGENQNKSRKINLIPFQRHNLLGSIFLHGSKCQLLLMFSTRVEGALNLLLRGKDFIIHVLGDIQVLVFNTSFRLLAHLSKIS